MPKRPQKEASRSLRGPGKAGTVKSVKQQLKKGGGGDRLIYSVPKDGSVIVRFMEEPEDWFGFYEVYDQESKAFYPLLAGDSEGKKGESPSFRYLANVVIVESDYDKDVGKCVPFRLPKSLANSLILKYEKYGTILDRDYDLTRAGEGFDTVYDCTPEAPTDFKFSKYDPEDLEDVLLKAYDEVWGEPDADEDEDDEPAPKKKRKRATPEPVEEAEEDDDESDDEPEAVADDEDDDESDAPEDDEDVYTEDELLAMDKDELVELADDYGIKLTPAQKKSKRKVVDAILAVEEE